MHIRRATPRDGASFVALVRALAAFEGLPGPDDAAAARLVADAFCDPPRFDLWVADVDGAVVGYAVGFCAYSTFCAGPTYYLEDLFVHPQARKKGIGKALLDQVLAHAAGEKHARVDWLVQRHNPAAIAFYEARGATVDPQWSLVRFKLSH